jgi:predicted helicase
VKLVPEWIRRDKTTSIRIDGALVDEYRLPNGFWEAKDTHDDLAKEVKIYVLDLGGNVRKNPKLSGTTHNVFGIQVGVSVNIFVRKRAAA